MIYQIPVLFAILIAMVFIWFGLIVALFKNLKNKHTEKYIEMGEPTLFLNNTFKSNWLLFKYLFKREHKILNDQSLTFLSDFMLIFFIVYIIIFFGLFFGVTTFVSMAKSP